MQITVPPIQQNDSVIQQQTITAYGDLGSLFVPTNQKPIKLTTDQMTLELNSKGGQLSKLTLNSYQNFEDAPIPMINEGNTDFNIEITTLDGRILNTRDMFFTSSTQDGAEAFEVEMKAALERSAIYSVPVSFSKRGTSLFLFC